MHEGFSCHSIAFDVDNVCTSNFLDRSAQRLASYDRLRLPSVGSFPTDRRTFSRRLAHGNNLFHRVPEESNVQPIVGMSEATKLPRHR